MFPTLHIATMNLVCLQLFPQDIFLELNLLHQESKHFKGIFDKCAKVLSQRLIEFVSCATDEQVGLFQYSLTFLIKTKFPFDQASNLNENMLYFRHGTNKQQQNSPHFQCQCI